MNGTIVPQSAYPAVGIVNSQCSGTLISPSHVLTARHCTTGGSGTFRLGGVTHTAIQQIDHPSDDLGILVLANDIPGVTPREILRETPLVGEMLTIVGYGNGGTTGNPVFDFPTLREGFTELQQVTPTLIRWIFDGNGEANTATGDSGGPAFVDRNGELVIAGVTSGGIQSDWWNPGDNSFDVRVDAFEGWIDSVVNPVPDDHVNVPGPGATQLTFDAAGRAIGTGLIAISGDHDVFQFTIVQSTPATILLTADSRNELDTVLTLFNAGLNQIADNDDINWPANPNSRININLNPGTYYAAAASSIGLGQETGSNSLEVQVDPAAVQIPGDFNGDQVVDGDDFLVWQASFQIDDGGDADTDGDDFLIWQDNFGTAVGRSISRSIAEDGLVRPGGRLGGDRLGIDRLGIDRTGANSGGDSVKESFADRRTAKKTKTTTAESGGQASIVNGTVVPQSAYPAVGKVVSNGGCTGTLISAHHVLTARHCMGPNITFELDEVAHSVGRQIEHPTDDLAILILSEDIEGVAPHKILKQSPVVGETLILVGYGNHGTTNDQQPGFGTLRDGHTELQFVDSELIGWTFDGDGESSHSLGDSGGPAFVERDGQLVIAGVASFITGSPNTPGTQGWDVRVDAFQRWIINTQIRTQIPLSSADFDVDGDVDGADFLVWQTGFNTNDSGDANGDGVTDGNDFLIWQSEFGIGTDLGSTGDARSIGHLTIPPSGGGNQFILRGKERTGRAIGSMIKRFPRHLRQIGHQRWNIGANSTDGQSAGRSSRLPEDYVDGYRSRDLKPTEPQNHSRIHERIFANRNDWLKIAVFEESTVHGSQL